MKRTPRLGFSVLKDVRVDLGGTEILVAEKLLRGIDVRALLQKVGRNRVSQGMATGGLSDVGRVHRPGMLQAVIKGVERH